MKNPYMPFWVDDYVRGTKRLSLEAKGLYVDMILELWIVGEFPNDLDYIADELKLNRRLFKRVFKEIKHKFEFSPIKDGVEFDCSSTIDEVLSHSRVTKERLKMISKSEINAINGSKGGKVRPNAKQTVKRSSSNIDSYSDLNLDLKKERVKEKAPAPNLDLPSHEDWKTAQDKSDPFFKTVPSYDENQIEHLCTLATTEYKSSQYAHEIRPYMLSLIKVADFKTIEKAIRNAAASSDPDHRYRPNFEKKFPNAQAVKAIAESAVKTPQMAVESKPINHLDRKLAEALEKERIENESN